MWYLMPCGSGMDNKTKKRFCFVSCVAMGIIGFFFRQSVCGNRINSVRFANSRICCEKASMLLCKALYRFMCLLPT